MIINIETLILFFKWCTIINGSILVLWTLFFVFAADLVYRTQKIWLDIPQATCNVVIYSFIGLFKIFFLVFNLVPYLALLIMK